MSDAPLVSGVHHVSFLVDDLDASIAFYRDLLGCEQIPRPALQSQGVWLRTGGTEVHLITREKDGPGPRATSPDIAYVNHIAFLVTDLGAVTARLARAGCEVAQGDPGLPQAFVLDPSGNLLELNQPV
jgi:catechol 2,3-dioxygenase-like lactoylglutathione lyase family enzyme